MSENSKYIEHMKKQMRNIISALMRVQQRENITDDEMQKHMIALSVYGYVPFKNDRIKNP